MNVYTQRTNYEFTFIMQAREGELQVTVHSVQIKQNVSGSNYFCIYLHLNLVNLVSSWNLNHNIKEFGSRGQTEKLDFIHFLESECL